MNAAADALKQWLTDDGLTMADLEGALVAAKARNGQGLLATIQRVRKGDSHKLVARARAGGPRVCDCSLGEKLYEDPDFAAAFPLTSDVGKRLRLVVDKAPSIQRNLNCWRTRREEKGCGEGRKYAPIQTLAKRYFLPETYSLLWDSRRRPRPNSGGSARRKKAVRAEEALEEEVPFAHYVPDDDEEEEEEEEELPFAHYVPDDEPDAGTKRKLSSSESSEQHQPAKRARLITAATELEPAPVGDPMEVVDPTPQPYFEKLVYADQVRIDIIAETFFRQSEEKQENKRIESYGLFDGKTHTELVNVDLREGTRLFEHLAGLQEPLARNIVMNMGVMPTPIGDEAARRDVRDKGDANRALHQLMTLTGEGHVASLHLSPPFLVRDDVNPVSIKPGPNTTLVIHVTGEVCIRFHVCTLPSEEVFNSAKVDFWSHSTRCVYDETGAWFSLGTGLHLLHVAPQTEVDPRVEILLAAADYAAVYIASLAPVEHRLADMVDSKPMVQCHIAVVNARHSAQLLTPEPLSPPASPRPEAPPSPLTIWNENHAAMSKKRSDEEAATKEHNRFHELDSVLDCVFLDPDDGLSFRLSTPSLMRSIFFSSGLVIVGADAFLINLTLTRDKLTHRRADGTISLRLQGEDNAVELFNEKLDEHFMALLQKYRQAAEDDLFAGSFTAFDELRRAGEKAGYGHVLVDNVYRATPISPPSPFPTSRVVTADANRKEFRLPCGRMLFLSGSVPPPSLLH
jgi:hypothetical protein